MKLIKMIRINEGKPVKQYLVTMMYKYSNNKNDIDLNYEYFKFLLDEAYQIALQKEAQNNDNE